MRPRGERMRQVPGPESKAGSARWRRWFPSWALEDWEVFGREVGKKF